MQPCPRPNAAPIHRYAGALGPTTDVDVRAGAPPAGRSTRGDRGRHGRGRWIARPYHAQNRPARQPLTDGPCTSRSVAGNPSSAPVQHTTVNGSFTGMAPTPRGLGPSAAYRNKTSRTTNAVTQEVGLSIVPYIAQRRTHPSANEPDRYPHVYPRAGATHLQPAETACCACCFVLKRLKTQLAIPGNPAPRLGLYWLPVTPSRHGSDDAGDNDLG